MPFEISDDETSTDGRERSTTLVYKEGDTQLELGVVINFVGDADLLAAYSEPFLHSLTGKPRRRSRRC
jgi:hypothetical protein